MCPADGEPQGGGWGASGILHAFILLLGGSCYFPPSHIIGSCLALCCLHTAMDSPISKPVLAKAGNIPAALAPTSGPSA